MVILSIDLGTTTTVMARLNEVGKPQIVMNWENLPFTYSAVEFAEEDPKQPILGLESKKNAGVLPCAFKEFKRQMGTDAVYKVAGRDFTAADLSAVMLRRLREHADNEFGGIAKLVMTIPANFSHKARQDTLAAASAAGLPVPDLIDEPTAAALYYIESSSQPLSGLCVVFDFGGGTHDVSLVDVSGRQVKVIRSKGVPKLGGMDFDQALLGLLRKKFEAEHGPLAEGDSDLTDYSAELAKQRLSESERVAVHVFSTQYGRKKIEVTRAEFEEVGAPFVAAAVACCSELLAEAALKPTQVQHIFMSGGSSLVPAVRQALEACFNRKAECRSPHQAIALGGAVYAASLVARDNPDLLTPTQREAIRPLVVRDATSKDLGMLITGLDGKEANEILIPKGTAIPAEIQRYFGVAMDGQKAVEFILTQSDPGSQPENVTTALLSLPEGSKAGQKIEVVFAYATGGLLSARFRDLNSGNVTECQMEVRSASTSGGS
jgi:molecular chaperone DnaK (HSP70)